MRVGEHYAQRSAPVARFFRAREEKIEGNQGDIVGYLELFLVIIDRVDVQRPERFAFLSSRLSQQLPQNPLSLPCFLFLSRPYKNRISVQRAPLRGQENFYQGKPIRYGRNLKSSRC